jgi:7-carboxy-7-deazaguanine synthase
VNECLINSIYRATEGEGIHIGTPQIFVRFQGCKIECKNCDSKDTWDFALFAPLNLNEVLSKIDELTVGGKIKRVSITGGDPQHPKHIESVLALTKKLKKKNFFVNLEATGLSISEELFETLDYISMDLKTPSTGVKSSSAIIYKVAKKYPNKFQVKSVIEHKDDFSFVHKIYEELEHKLDEINFPWCLTPAYNRDEEFPMRRFDHVIKWNEEVGGIFRVIGQQHKWIYGPNESLV